MLSNLKGGSPIFKNVSEEERDAAVQDLFDFLCEAAASVENHPGAALLVKDINAGGIAVNADALQFVPMAEAAIFAENMTNKTVLGGEKEHCFRE